MPFSQSDREFLIARVQQKLTTRRASRCAIAEVVDHVAARLDLPDESVATVTTSSMCVVAVSAASVPDLASRVRAHLAPEGIASVEHGTATVGRHTVVVMRIAETELARVEAVAAALGARCARVAGEALGGRA